MFSFNSLKFNFLKMIVDAVDNDFYTLTCGISTQTVPPVEQHTLKLEPLLLLLRYFLADWLCSSQSGQLCSLLLVSAVLVEHARNGSFSRLHFTSVLNRFQVFILRVRFRLWPLLVTDVVVPAVSTLNRLYLFINYFFKTLSRLLISRESTPKGSFLPR